MREVYMPKSHLPTAPLSLRRALVEASRGYQWERVDNLAPLASEMDPRGLILTLGRTSLSENPHIRTALMTAWSYMEPTTRQHQTIHLRRALEIMENDDYAPAAMWAAVTAARYYVSPGFTKVAKAALKDFSARILTMDSWGGR